jgi:monovalent cation:H+ antiporter-2, CPA2 family
MKDSFLFQMMIYLLAAVIMVPIAKKIRLGSVLGYLLAGVIIGPACFKVIGHESHELMNISEFGIVMMLFVIGLELEPALLWRMRKQIAGMGGLQVGITAVVVMTILLLSGLPLRQGIAIGCIIAMSSTAIVMQTLAEKNALKTAAGESSFAVLLFQDISVIPILAIFPFLSTAPATVKQVNFIDSLPAWAHASMVLIAVAIIIIAGRYLINPLFKIVARTGLREMFTATGLLLVVSIAVLMSFVGLSPALGAFVAGVVLANSAYKHELESAIDPFKGLLLGLFFMAVGASIDFHLLASRPLFILALVTGIMALKASVLFSIGRLFRLSNAQNTGFSIGMSQIGEFAFVLLSFATQEYILPQETAGILTACVALSMAFTPLLNAISDRHVVPRLCAGGESAQTNRDPDEIHEDNPVIIAGFGHFGNIVGRFLQANKVSATVLDNNSDNVDYLRSLGHKVYYGDATRYELLEIAGAMKAKVIVVALGDEEQRLELIDTIKKHFPHLHIMVRSSNRFDAYDLMNAGVLHIYRETLDTSLRLGVDVLRLLGHRAHESTRSSKLFFYHDERTLKHLSSIRNNDEYIAAAREYIQDLELTMDADRHAASLRTSEGWEAEAGRG